MNLPVLVDDLLVFFGDPYTAFSVGIFTGAGIEYGINVHARITLLNDGAMEG